MTEPLDPVTTTLTGTLAFYLLLAAALTFPLALGILRLYARAVRRSWRDSSVGPGARRSCTPSPAAPTAC
jgi:hypothetical protein